MSLNSLKDLVNMDRQKCNSQYDDVNKQCHYLQTLNHSFKAELNQKLKEHRDEYLTIFSQSDEERARSEKIRQEKQEHDDFNRQRLQSDLEKKLDYEQKQRTQNEDDIRRYIETKFMHLSDQHKTDEKLTLEREKRMMT